MVTSQNAETESAKLLNCTPWVLRYRQTRLSRHSYYMQPGARDVIARRGGICCIFRCSLGTLRVKRGDEKWGSRSCVEPGETYFLCWNSNEERIVILKEEEILQNDWCFPNGDNPYLESLSHLWETAEKDFAVEWRMETLENTCDLSTITVVHRTRQGFETSDDAANRCIIDKESKANVRVRKIEVAWDVSNPTGGNASFKSPPTTQKGAKGNVYVESLLCPHDPQSDGPGTATFRLLPNSSVAVWQPVVNVFGNDFYLNHTVCGSFDTPQYPHAKKATVHYIIARSSAEQLSTRTGDLISTETQE